MVVGAGWMLKFIMTRVARLSEDYRELITNHLVHNTVALVALERAIVELRLVLARDGIPRDPPP